jgi:CheY-like chemotaxis protein
MGPEVLSHLFEPFFTRKDVGRGTGLGLATVYGIVESTGGCIDVSSEPGRGTTFKVYLPLSEGTPEPSPEVANGAAPRGGNETILLVEDDEIVRELGVTVLSSEGFRVLAARNGAEALKLASSERIDLVLTDVVMPGMSGREFVSRFLESSPDVRVLYTSGYTKGSIKSVDAISDHADFLEKPFTPKSLVAKVREVLDRTPRNHPRNLSGEPPKT